MKFSNRLPLRKYTWYSQDKEGRKEEKEGGVRKASLNLLILTLKDKTRRQVISVTKQECTHKSDVYVLISETVTCKKHWYKKTETEPINTFTDSCLKPKSLKQDNKLIYSGTLSLKTSVTYLKVRLEEDLGVSQSFGKTQEPSPTPSPPPPPRHACWLWETWSAALGQSPESQSRLKPEFERVTYYMAAKWGEGAGQEPPVWLGPRTQAHRQPCPTAGKPNQSLHPSALGKKRT